MSAETWRPIAEWEGLYEVSDMGRVRSLPRYHFAGRILRPGITPDGYLNATLSDYPRRATRKLHRLVAETFLGPKPEGWNTCHIDGDKTNNAVSNLRYATKSENERDKLLHGTNYNANKTHCLRGHEFTPENTRVMANGGRYCRACCRIRSRERRVRRADRLTTSP